MQITINYDSHGSSYIYKFGCRKGSVNNAIKEGYWWQDYWKNQ